MTAKDSEPLNFEQGSILEGCGLCRADDEGDFASNLPARQKDSFFFCSFLSFLHFPSDFIVQVSREGLLSHPLLCP